jgi:hypothetical protein
MQLICHSSRIHDTLLHNSRSTVLPGCACLPLLAAASSSSHSSCLVSPASIPQEAHSIHRWHGMQGVTGGPQLPRIDTSAQQKSSGYAPTREGHSSSCGPPTLPTLSFTVPKPSALRSWYVRASEPIIPAFLLCLWPRPMVAKKAVR